MDIDSQACDFPEENKFPAASQGKKGAGQRDTIFFVTQVTASSSCNFLWIK
jgi:hypothetical protein